MSLVQEENMFTFVFVFVLGWWEMARELSRVDFQKMKKEKKTKREKTWKRNLSVFEGPRVQITMHWKLKIHKNCLFVCHLPLLRSLSTLIRTRPFSLVSMREERRALLGKKLHFLHTAPHLIQYWISALALAFNAIKNKDPKLCQYALKELTFKATMEDLGPPLTIYLWCLLLHNTHTHTFQKSRVDCFIGHAALHFASPYYVPQSLLEHQMNIMKQFL